MDISITILTESCGWRLQIPSDARKFILQLQNFELLEPGGSFDSLGMQVAECCLTPGLYVRPRSFLVHIEASRAIYTDAQYNAQHNVNQNTIS